MRSPIWRSGYGERNTYKTAVIGAAGVSAFLPYVSDFCGSLAAGYGLLAGSGWFAQPLTVPKEKIGSKILGAQLNVDPTNPTTETGTHVGAAVWDVNSGRLIGNGTLVRTPGSTANIQVPFAAPPIIESENMMLGFWIATSATAGSQGGNTRLSLTEVGTVLPGSFAFDFDGGSYGVAVPFVVNRQGGTVYDNPPQDMSLTSFQVTIPRPLLMSVWLG